MQKKPMRFVEDVLERFTHVELGERDVAPDQNRAAAGFLEYGRRMGLTRFGVGGSDAHGLRPIGTFVTLAPTTGGPGFPAIRDALARRLDPSTPAIYPKADLCRTDLLVEIEGVSL